MPLDEDVRRSGSERGDAPRAVDAGSPPAAAPLTAWEPLRPPLEVHAGEVHLVRLPLECSRDVAEALRAELVEAEQARAARFHHERDRLRYVVTRATLRRLLADVLALPPREVRLVEGAYGKPALAPAHGSALRFNVSHSGELALLGFALGSELGVDVEQERADLDVQGMAQVVFSPAEQRTLAALEPSERQRTFFRLWALKEAVIKAEGWGFAFPSHTFTVSVAPAGPPVLLPQAPSPAPLASWTLREPAVARGYAAAVALGEPSLRPVLWQAEAAPRW